MPWSCSYRVRRAGGGYVGVRPPDGGCPAARRLAPAAQLGQHRRGDVSDGLADRVLEPLRAERGYKLPSYHDSAEVARGRTAALAWRRIRQRAADEHDGRWSSNPASDARLAGRSQTGLEAQRFAWSSGSVAFAGLSSGW